MNTPTPYRFDARFVPAIAAYYKLTTIRGRHALHARVGEPIICKDPDGTPIIPDPTCTSVLGIDLRFDKGLIEEIILDGAKVADLDAFAIQDGFVDRHDMSAYFARNTDRNDILAGTLIGWEPSANTFGEAA